MKQRIQESLDDFINEGKYTSPDYFLQELIDLANADYVNSHIDILRDKQPNTYEQAYKLVLGHIHNSDIANFNIDVNKLCNKSKIDFKI
jgi:hypothetical protein